MSLKTTAPQSLYRIEDGHLRLSFHEGQARAWKSERRFTFVLAGTQSGKTSWGPWWLWREIQRGGAGDYLAVTASYDLFKLKMLPELRQVFERTLGIARYWAAGRVLELRNPETGQFEAKTSDDPMWGRIILRSAAAGGGLESTTAKAAWLDECGQDEFTVESWEAVLRRLSLHQGRALGTTTPYNLGWVKTEVYDRWRAGDPDFAVIQFASYLNPLFSRAEYERAKRTMPDWRFRMFYRGELTKPAGLIYDCFEERTDVVDDFALPAHWPRYVGLDFGGANTAKLWLAEHPEQKVYYAYRESLDGGKSTGEHVTDALNASRGENVILWMGGAKSETQQRMDWRDAGIYVHEPEVADVESGIDRVYALLKTRRLKIFRSLAGLRDELGSYRRKLDENGQVTEEIVNKRKYHRLDALRYGVQGFLAAPATAGELQEPDDAWFAADRNVNPWE